MSRGGAGLRNIVLISQVAIAVMVPIFLCLAIGVWLDNRFDTWFTIPLLIVGFLAGGRNAYILVMNVVNSEEKARKKQLEEDIKRKVDKAKHENDDVKKD